MKKIFFFIFLIFYPLNLFAACFSDVDLGTNILEGVSKFSSSKLGIVVPVNDTDLNKAENFVVVGATGTISLSNKESTASSSNRLLRITSVMANNLGINLIKNNNATSITDIGCNFNLNANTMTIPFKENYVAAPGIYPISVPAIVTKKVGVNDTVFSGYALTSKGTVQLGINNDGPQGLSLAEFYTTTNGTISFQVGNNAADKMVVTNSGIEFHNSVNVQTVEPSQYSDVMTVAASDQDYCGPGGYCRYIDKNQCIAGGKGCWYYSKILYNWQNDLAEFFPSSDLTVSPGEIVMADSNEKKHVRKADRKNQEKIIGVVSTNPALCFEEKSLFINENRNPIYPHNPSKPAIALKGRVPVKISLEGGSIEIGDLITISSVSGVGMKQNTFGRSVGVALEDYSEKKTENDTIYVFINPEFQFGNISKDNIKRINQISTLASSLEERTEKIENQIQEIEKILL